MPRRSSKPGITRQPTRTLRDKIAQGRLLLQLADWMKPMRGRPDSSTALSAVCGVFSMNPRGCRGAAEMSLKHFAVELVEHLKKRF